MVLGAILGVGTHVSPADAALALPRQPLDVLNPPFSCIEVLGRSTVDRIVERCLAADAERVTILVNSSETRELPCLTCDDSRVKVEPVADIASAVAQTIEQYRDSGIDHAILSTANAYTECDFIDLLWFHRGARQAITKVVNHQSDPELWMLDCNKVNAADVVSVLTDNSVCGPASYMVSEYTLRIDNFRGLRQLAMDGLNTRCGVRPNGEEVRPGVWIAEGADIHKRSRIVAPAYIGRRTKICEDTLITRCSSVESFCEIDYGTVIEDSSVLTNSYVGIWLDVAHAVVNGSRLVNLSRDVDLGITDASVLRSNLMSKVSA